MSTVIPCLNKDLVELLKNAVVIEFHNEHNVTFFHLDSRGVLSVQWTDGHLLRLCDQASAETFVALFSSLTTGIPFLFVDYDQRGHTHTYYRQDFAEAKAKRRHLPL